MEELKGAIDGFLNQTLWVYASTYSALLASYVCTVCGRTEGWKPIPIEPRMPASVASQIVTLNDMMRRILQRV
jgi:hypothetical protein